VKKTIVLNIVTYLNFKFKPKKYVIKQEILGKTYWINFSSNNSIYTVRLCTTKTFCDPFQCTLSTSTVPTKLNLSDITSQFHNTAICVNCISYKMCYVHLSSIFIQNTLPSSNGPLLITLKLNGKFRAHMIDIMLTYLKNLKVFIYGIYTKFKKLHIPLKSITTHNLRILFYVVLATRTSEVSTAAMLQ
jgi:hypothetical protein